jgi:hypothetical protein
VVKVLPGQVHLIPLRVRAAAILRAPLGQDPPEGARRAGKERPPLRSAQVGRPQRRLTLSELGKGPLGGGVEKRLWVDPPPPSTSPRSRYPVHRRPLGIRSRTRRGPPERPEPSPRRAAGPRADSLPAGRPWLLRPAPAWPYALRHAGATPRAPRPAPYSAPAWPVRWPPALAPTPAAPGRRRPRPLQSRGPPESSPAAGAAAAPVRLLRPQPPPVPYRGRTSRACSPSPGRPASQGLTAWPTPAGRRALC